MQSYYPVSIKDTRNNLSEIVSQVSVAGKSFGITKFGKLKALIIPVDDIEKKSSKEKLHQALNNSSGLWKNRQDIKDPIEWIEKIRRTRYDVFG